MSGCIHARKTNRPSRLVGLNRLLWVVALFPWAAVGGAQAPALKIGVVDMKEITDRSQSIQARMKEIEKSLEPRKAQLDKSFMEVERMKRDLRNRRSVLSDEDVRAEQRHIRRIEGEVEDIQYEINKEFDRFQIDVITPELERIEQTIQRIAHDDDYDLILMNEGVLFYSDRVDITPLVIQELDRKGSSPRLPAFGDKDSSSD